jgi:purine-binding chemotaxis protein CheW
MQAQEHQVQNHQSAPTEGREHIQFLTFSVAGEEYGVDITQVHEVKGWSEPTRLPNSLSHIRGVLNLRGTIIPIHDMRVRFLQQSTEPESTHVIIVTQFDGRMAGMLVDTVNDILTTSSADIKSIPEDSEMQRSHFLNGMITEGERMVVVLNIPQLLTHDTGANGEQAPDVQAA